MFPIYNYQSLVDKYSSGSRSVLNSEQSQKKNKQKTHYYVRNFEQHDFEKDISTLQSRLEGFKLKTEEMEKKYNDSHGSISQSITRSIYREKQLMEQNRDRQFANSSRDRQLTDHDQQQQQTVRVVNQYNQKMEELIDFNQRILETNQHLDQENRFMKQQIYRMKSQQNNAIKQSVYQRLKSVYEDLDRTDKRDRTKIAILIDRINNKLKS